MRLELTGRQFSITPAVRKVVSKELAPTLRLLNDNAVSAQVVLTREKAQHRAEVTLHARGEHFLHGAGTGRGVSEAMNAAMAKIDRQAEKLKGKWDSRKRQSAKGVRSTKPAAGAPDLSLPDQPEAPRVVRSRYAVKPLSIDDAALHLERVDDAFVVFRHADDDSVAILYRRKDGNLGLIQP